MKKNYTGNINRLYLLKQDGQYIQQAELLEKNIPLYRNIFGRWVRDNGDVPTTEEEALDYAYDIAAQHPDIPNGGLIGGYSYLDEGSIKPTTITKRKMLQKKIN